MTLPWLVAPRLDDPTADAAAAVAPPMLAAIRCVFGVGVEPGAVPDGDGLRPVYCVQLPVDAPGSLDADDTHEFDAASLLGALQVRALGRAWAMRLEFELVQTAGAAAQVDLFLVDAPAEPLHLLHSSPQPGGGRRLTFGTGLVHTPAGVARLAGSYHLEQRSGDGAAAGACAVQLGLTEYEFE
ncbi:hypothetical protein [Nannocystis sp.]|uniref:hypothetical protein n=1 Tax=Nannocystis sp. TaxID=1962667 RepID=UPI002427BB72|nr:hypothetical protein [Nannocystis sp.]MBK7826851.1 hypothetical protein [Nannocystis sp.]MBK9758359.1 hypothetical protein [Nannocystis sp.]